MGYPAFESLGLRLARAEDEGVEAGFVDDVCFPLTTYVIHSPFVFV